MGDSNGSDTTPPNKDDKNYNSWIVKASKVMHIFMCTIDKGLRTRIEDAETPKEAWDILASLFSRRNPARLQLLEKELMNTTQGTLSINEYFLKVKNLCREIEQLDAEAKFGDNRIRRIIINGLKPEYNSFIMALQGWEKQPSLIELENLLANQEALEQQMSKVTIKPLENEEALFSAKRINRKVENRNYTKDHNGRRCKHCGHKSDSEDEEEHQRKYLQPKRGECFICGRKGHYAKDCKFLKNIQNNLAKIECKTKESEEVWDFEATYAVVEDAQATYAVVEDALKDECDFEATYAVEDDVAEEEEWDLSKHNDELWIEDLEPDDNNEISATTMIEDTLNDHHVDGVTTEIKYGGLVAVKEETDGFILSQEGIELGATQPGVKDWLADAGVVKCKNHKEEFTCEGAEKQGEPSIVNQPKPPDQVKHAKFDVGANIKRPPERAEQLDIKGEY